MANTKNSRRKTKNIKEKSRKFKEEIDRVLCTTKINLFESVEMLLNVQDQ